VDSETLLTSTRSARRSLDLSAPLDAAQIRDCLQIAFHAANGSNQQSWQWIVVEDPDLRREIAAVYRKSYLRMTGGAMVSDLLPDDEFGRLMSSTEWLVTHLAQVPLHVIPCYEPYLPDFGDEDGPFQLATLYGSIFPAVWNFQLALHTRGFGSCIMTMHLLYQEEVATLLGIPDSYVQGCLLPVARLRPGTVFRSPPRRPAEDVVAIDTWGEVTNLAQRRERHTVDEIIERKLMDRIDRVEIRDCLTRYARGSTCELAGD
jgi:nitroreductase